MRVGFFVPCYVDMVAPQAAISSYELLKRLGVDVEFIDHAVCCGLPMTDMGYRCKARNVERNLVKYLSGYDYIVIPSGVCTDQMRNEFAAVNQTPEVVHIRETSYDVVEFLHDILRVDSLPWAHFPARVALHNGCHSLRFLHQARPSELQIPDYSKTADLLRLVDGIEIGYATRRDECCGFGGTFTIWDQSCSGQMGIDKVSDYERNGFAHVVSADFSCLLHQSCVARKLGMKIKFHYIAEILNGDAEP